MSRLRLAIGSLFAAILLFSGQAYAAAAPDTLGYQGRLTENGVAVSSQVSITFRVYSALTGGVALWSETQSVTPTNGLYSVVLGKTTAFPANLFGQALWISVQVAPDAVEMAPRQELASTPYSQQAKRADSAALADSATTAVTATSATTATTAVTATTANALSDPALAQYGLSGLSIVNVVDASGWFGSNISVTQGKDGLPVIAYYDSTNNHLKVAKCSTLACMGTSTITTVDPTFGAGYLPSIALGGTDGLPVISYMEAGTNTLKVAKCSTPACTGTAIIIALDHVGNQIGSNAIAMDALGLPVISYFSSGGLKVAKCYLSDCSGTPTKTVVDNTVGWGDTSIIMGFDGFPIISYGGGINNALKVAKCGTADCAGYVLKTTVDSGGSIGYSNSIILGDDNRPVISYREYFYGNLKVAKCSTIDCSGLATINTVDSTSQVGQYTSITLGGSDGLPVIAYSGANAMSLKVAKCSVADCSSATISTVDASGMIGNPSISIGADGLPVISYLDANHGYLKVAKCVNARCGFMFGRR